MFCEIETSDILSVAKKNSIIILQNNKNGQNSQGGLNFQEYAVE